jgi:peptidoglycan/xylan/chitin deacetylase (PgdA/CDA1 family)
MVAVSLVAAPQSAEALTGTCNSRLAGTTTRVAPGSGKTVALTFDDNSAANLPAIMAILRKHIVRATFFNTGKQDAAMPALVSHLAAEGHLVEPHTWEHQYPTKANGYWSKTYLSRQITTTAAQQQKLTGRVSCFFRPPGGYLNNVAAVTRAQGMQNVMWSVDTQDWSQPSRVTAAGTAAIVKRGTDLRYSNINHPIVLMHGGKASSEPESRVTSFRGNTIAALPKIIEWYKARGYRFVAMDGTSGLTPAPTGIGFTRDNRPDILARSSDGALLRYSGRGDGYVTGPARIGGGWNVFQDFVATDWTGDRRSDVLARKKTGELMLYTGNGNGGFTGSPRQLRTGWQMFDAIVAPGDVNGDKRNDLLARKPDGSLWLYRGNGRGGITGISVKVGSGYQRYRTLLTPGDFNGDGKADLLGRDAAGVLWLLAGTGTGSFKAPVKVAAGFAGYTHVFSAGDLSGDRKPDVVGLRASDGRYVFFAGNGKGALAAGKAFNTGWRHTQVTGVR